jgi:DNA-binding transcriptional ArsR family regulator
MMMSPTIEIDCVAFCKALADETRQGILRILLEGEKCVGDLNILKSLGLVESRKDGKYVYYGINRDNVIECCGMLIAQFGCDPDSIIEVECEE